MINYQITIRQTAACPVGRGETCGEFAIRSDVAGPNDAQFATYIRRALPRQIFDKAILITGPALILLVIVLFGTGMRFQGLSAKSIWLDEALSWRLLQFPVSEMIERTGAPHTTHPPLFFLLLRMWSALWGDSEFALRSLSAIFGSITIVGTYFFVRELIRFGRAAGPLTAAFQDGALFAAAFVAVSPLQIFASQQIRGYSLGTALFVWSSCLLFRGLRATKGGVPYWFGYMSLAAALCYTHHFGLISVTAQLMWLIAYALFCDRSQARLGVAACLVMAVVYLPWAQTLIAQSEVARHAWSRPIQFGEVPSVMSSAIMRTGAERNLSSEWPNVAFGAIFLVGSLYLASRRGWREWFLVVTGLTPVIAALIFSICSSRSIFYPRYLTFCQISWLVGLAIIVVRIPVRLERVYVAALLVIVSLYACYEAWNVIGPNANPGLRTAIQHVLRDRDEGELVVSRTPFDFFGLVYYTRDKVKPLLLVEVADRHLQRGAPHLEDSDLLTIESLAASKSDGVWLISSDSYDASKAMFFDVPDNWQLIEARTYYRDYWLEEPLLVEHYRINAARSAKSDGDRD